MPLEREAGRISFTMIQQFNERWGGGMSWDSDNFLFCLLATRNNETLFICTFIAMVTHNAIAILSSIFSDSCLNSWCLFRTYLLFIHHLICHNITEGPSWSWSYGSWIFNYLRNHCLSSLKMWVQTPFMARSTWYNTIYICDKSLSVTCSRSVVFSGYSCFLHQ